MMKLSTLVCAALVVLFAGDVGGVDVDRCDIYRVMLDNHIVPEQAARLICIAKSTSSYQLDYVNSFGDHSYQGLFGIHDGYWCENGSAGKGCNMDCNEMRRDLKASVRCALLIFKQQGFAAWGSGCNYMDSQLKEYIVNC